VEQETGKGTVRILCVSLRKEMQSSHCLAIKTNLEEAVMSKNIEAGNKPNINVTPLIDVLLVVLIIFMLAAPLKPHRFAAKLPAQPDDRNLPPDPKTLVVTIQPDQTLTLNGLTDDMGTVEDPSKLSIFLTSLFKQRKTNHVYRAEMLSRIDLPEDYRIERTVFIKAPRSISYGSVAKVIDGLKGAGAEPVGLQLDGLN
jgi:biopolymer transport protein ExbD